MNSKALPCDFQEFFWDVNIEDIHLPFHKSYVIGRLLNFGNHITLRWLFAEFTQEEIQEAVVTDRELDLKTARYWQDYFDLQEGEMRCFGTSWIDIDLSF